MNKPMDGAAPPKLRQGSLLKVKPAHRAKKTPIPVRFSETETVMLEELKESTSLSLADIVRRAVRFAVPKFRSGEINPLEVPQ